MIFLDIYVFPLMELIILWIIFKDDSLKIIKVWLLNMF